MSKMCKPTVMTTKINVTMTLTAVRAIHYIYVLQIEDMQNKTEVRRKEIEYLHGQEKVLHAAFITTLGDSKFSAFLTKVFKKKIKRSHKKGLLDGKGKEISKFAHMILSIFVSPNNGFTQNKNIKTHKGSRMKTTLLICEQEYEKHVLISVDLLYSGLVLAQHQ